MVLRLPAGCIGSILLLTACTLQESNQLLSRNVASFSTRVYEGTEIPQDVLKRAAGITIRQNYTHFTLTKEDAAAKRHSGPGINLNYGRSPYGFGDAAQTGPEGFSTGLSFSPPRTEWTVHMISSHDPATSHAYDARTLIAK